jgi:hypothetical protein
MQLMAWLGVSVLLGLAVELARPDLQGMSGNLWITGRMSPEAQRQFAALGWTVRPNVLPPWQR